MVYNFLKGTAGINVLAKHVGADVWVIDVGVDQDFGTLERLIHKKVIKGTKNFTKEPAMTREEAIRCIEVGMEVTKEAIEKSIILLV